MAIVIVMFIIIPVPTSTALGQEVLAPTFGVSDDREGVDVLGAFVDSLKLLTIEHGWRVGFQEKTRSELGGNFWGDYRRSVRIGRSSRPPDAVVAES